MDSDYGLQCIEGEVKWCYEAYVERLPYEVMNVCLADAMFSWSMILMWNMIVCWC